MKVYRIATKRYADLTGAGGLYSWGRWHEKGHRVIYAAENRSLAAWEKVVHVSSVNLLPDNLVMIEIEIPEEKVFVVPDEILVKGWDSYPYTKETVQYGSGFLSQSTNLILKVPSVVIRDEYNFVINPNGKDIDRCEILNISPFKFDKRVFENS